MNLYLRLFNRCLPSTCLELLLSSPYPQVTCGRENVYMKTSRLPISFINADCQQVVEQGFPSPPSCEDLRNILQGTEKESFQKCFDKFFMIDLFPENAARFPVSYREVKELANKFLEGQSTI